MITVNGYLSRLAQNIWPDAIVSVVDEGNGVTWILRHGKEKFGLGGSFHEAKQAVHAIVKSEHVLKSVQVSKISIP